MLCGMTYDQFCHASVEELEAYEKLHRKAIEQKNQELWLQGLYIYNAVGVNLGNVFRKKGQKALNYLEGPLDIFEKTEEEKQAIRKKEQEKITAYLKSLQQNWVKLYGDKDK
mgnify:CR=1 FL=1